MTRFDVAVLSFRILALYLWLEAASTFSNLTFFLAGGFSETPGWLGMVLGWALWMVGVVALGCVVFQKAPAIARRLHPGSEPMSTSSRPEIGALALKICGILLFADCLTNLGRTISIGAVGLGAPGWDPGATRIAAGALTGVVGAVVFFAAPRIARRMFGAPVKPMAQPLYAHVQAVTFSVLGIWLLVRTLPEFGESLGERIRLGEWGRGGWAQLTLVSLGLALFLGGTGLSAFWYWVRHAGLGARPERPA